MIASVIHVKVKVSVAVIVQGHNPGIKHLEIYNFSRETDLLCAA